MKFSLDFLNKNTLRKYPLQQTFSGFDKDGLDFSNAIFAGIQFSSSETFPDIYVSRVAIKNNYVSVLFKSVLLNHVIGYAQGVVTKDFEVIPIVGLEKEVSGTVTFGYLAALADCIYTFEDNEALLEPSCIFVYPAPGVTSFVAKGNKATGKVTTSLTNLTIATSNPLTLSIVNPNFVMSNGDKRIEYKNCGVTYIQHINGVTPDENGNIDIYAIEPLRVDITDEDNAIISLPADVTIDDVCPERIATVPPTNNSNDYYADIATVEIPEYKTWDT